MNPIKRAIAIFILRLFGGDKDKVPYPLLNFVIEHNYGAWAGASIYFSFRQFDYQTKLNKFKYTFLSYFLPIIILIVILVGAIQDSENFFFGFVQNLLSEIILVLLILYILPKILNPKRNFKISLFYEKIHNDQSNDNSQEINLILKNSGTEVYKSNEIYWEVFIPFDYVHKREFTLINGNCEASEELFSTMLKLYGYNPIPIFIDQEFQIAKVNFKLFYLKSQNNSPCKIYYKLLTINGNIPKFEGITKDFFGLGVPIERYPMVGEMIIREW